MMKKLRSFSKLFLLFLFVGAASTANAQTVLWDESINGPLGSTLPYTNVGTISSPGTYQVIGTGSNIDNNQNFNVTVGSNMLISIAAYSYSSTGGVGAWQFDFNGDHQAFSVPSASGSGNFGGSFPLGPGTYVGSAFGAVSTFFTINFKFTITAIACVPPAITTQPTDQTVCSGSNATFIAAASGTAAPTVQWQFSSNGGVSYSNWPGATSPTLVVPTTTSVEGYKFRAVFTNSCGTATSNAATVHVNTSPTATIPLEQDVCIGGTAVFSTTVSGNPAPTIQWQTSSNAGITWTNIPGATNTSVSFTVSLPMDGSRYQAIVSNTCATISSISAPLFIYNPPSIANNPTNQTICKNATATFTAVPASGTHPAPAPQWQVSTDGGASWADVGGATNSSYSVIGGGGNSGNMYRAMFKNVCGSATTTSALLTVNAPPVITTNPVTLDICSGTLANFTAASSGGIPAPSIQWQISSNSGVTWTDIAGATNNTYSFTATPAFDNTWYHAVYSNSCGTVTSLFAALTVRQGAIITTNPASQTICAGSNATFTAAATGAPAPTMQWQVSTNGGVSFVNIPGATNSTYSFTTATTDNNNQYRIIFNNLCGPVTSPAATLTVNIPVSISIQPVSQAICNGTGVTFTAAALGTPAPSAQWQVSTNGGGTWTNIGGATNGTYSTTVSASMNGWQYRAAYTNPCGTVPTNPAILSINTGPVVTTDPLTQTICATTNVNFTAAANATPAATVQWYQSIDNGVTWTLITGATNTSYGFTTTLSQNNNRYRAIFTNSCGFATTASAILSVNAPPVITNQPVSAAVCNGSIATFSSYATGPSTPTMQWQRSTDGGATWLSIGGANNNVYSFTVSLANNGNQFRCLFTNNCGSTPSAAATLSINTLPIVTTNPVTQAICNGNNVTFTAAATGTPAPTVQWQKSVDNGLTWGNLIGATSTSYTFAVSTLNNYYRYRAVFTNTCGSTNSAAAVLTINMPPQITVQPNDKETCEGTSTSYTIAATGTALTYQWLVNTGDGTGFNPVLSGPGYTGINTPTLGVLNVTENMSGYFYQCQVSGTCIPLQLSNVAKLTVDTLPEILSQTSNNVICEGENIIFGVTARGTGLRYVWQMNNGSGWAYFKQDPPYSGVYTSQLLITKGDRTLNGVAYRCMVYGTCSPAVYSTPLSLVVNTAPQILSQSSTQVTICNTATDSMMVEAIGTNLTYQWQLSVTGGAIWIDLAGAYTNKWVLKNVDPTMDGQMYRCVVHGTCPPDTISAPVTIHISNKTNWTGAVSTKWSNPLNWSCGVLPVATTEVYIDQYAQRWPEVDIATAICDSIFMSKTTRLSFTGTNSTLTLKGSIACMGCIFDASAGTVVYAGSKFQTIEASTYNTLEVNSEPDKKMNGDVTVLSTMAFSSGRIVMEDNNVILGPTANIQGGDENSHFATNGMGVVKMQNVGAGGKSDPLYIPMSDGSTYTPLTFSNDGSLQTFRVAVYDNINTTYDKYLRPVGSAFDSNAVAKSWLLAADSGGSHVKLTLQWNAQDELPGFNRLACYISNYKYPDWLPAPAITHSVELGGAYELTMSDITNMSVFAVTSAVGGSSFIARHGYVILYPNPATDQMFIKFNATPGRVVNIYILNAYGREVYRTSVNPYSTFDGVVQVNVGGLIPGEYMVNVVDVDNNNEIRSGRFIKK